VIYLPRRIDARDLHRLAAQLTRGTRGGGRRVDDALTAGGERRSCQPGTRRRPPETLERGRGSEAAAAAPRVELETEDNCHV